MAVTAEGYSIGIDFPTSERPIDDLRPFKVICIGAGISGILAGIRLPQKIKNLDLTIFEKNDDIGGTWYENKYPGVASGELDAFVARRQVKLRFNRYTITWLPIYFCR